MNRVIFLAALAAPAPALAIQAIGGQGAVPAPEIRPAVPDVPRAAPVEKPLILRETGRRYRSSPGPGKPAETILYLLTVGDTARADQAAFSLPNEAFLDPAAIAERDRWRECMLQPALRKALEDPYEKADFSEPCGYVWRRMSLSQGELPPPFDRVSPAAVAPVIGIFRYKTEG